jgi:hypothetical protein
MEEHITNETFSDDASFCEWIDYSRTDERVRKGDELEEKDTFEFFLLSKKNIMKCSPRIVQ